MALENQLSAVIVAQLAGSSLAMAVSNLGQRRCKVITTLSVLRQLVRGGEFGRTASRPAAVPSFSDSVIKKTAE